MTRPTIDNEDVFSTTIWRQLKFGTTQLGNVVNYVITINHPPIIVFVPTGAQNILMPLESTAKGLVFIIANAAGGAFAITVQNSVAGALPFGGVSIPQNESVLMWCDGTSWRAIAGAGIMTAP